MNELPVGIQDVRIAFIAAGSAACHCIAGGVDGKLYTWGRNEVCLRSPADLCYPPSVSPATFSSVVQSSLLASSHLVSIPVLQARMLCSHCCCARAERAARARRLDTEECAHCCSSLSKPGSHRRWSTHLSPQLLLHTIPHILPCHKPQLCELTDLAAEDVQFTHVSDFMTPHH